MPVVESLPWKSRPVAATAPATPTAAELLAEPPVPVQVNVKVLLAADNAALLAEPEVSWAPDHAPLAMQESALVDDQVRFDIPPLGTLSGMAVSATSGNGATVTVADALALPPAPEQLSV